MNYTTKNLSNPKITKSPKAKKSSAIIFVILGILAIIGLVAITSYNSAIDQKNSDSADKISYKIETGEQLPSISQSLVDNGLLKAENKTYFEIYVRLNNLYPNFQAGTFKIAKNLTIKEISDILQNAGVPDIWITIPEGLRKDEIAEIFSREFGTQEDNAFSKSEFLSLTNDKAFIDTLELNMKDLDNLEGLLFPDKYLFMTSTDAQSVIVKMVENFKEKTNNNLSYENLIKASMIEREGTTLEDKKIISDIIDRRLAEGWFLGFDTTSLYAAKDWKAIPDVISPSPYNTYINLGYPPTPICNPGIASITAALNPTPNNYYFFLHDKQSIPHYSVTYAEHERFAEIYLNQ